MCKSEAANELAGLRQFVEKLESGYLRLRRNQADVTRSEIDILKREITNLERILNRAKLLAQKIKTSELGDPNLPSDFSVEACQGTSAERKNIGDQAMPRAL
jgi:hypothetical protein